MARGGEVHDEGFGVFQECCCITWWGVWTLDINPCDIGLFVTFIINRSLPT